MATLTYALLRSACSPGGSSALTSVTELTPAGGSHCGVAPARYVDGKTATFAYETRFVDGQPVTAVLLDSKQSQGNRVEAAVLQEVRDGHPLLSRVPRMQVSYRDGGVICTDLELPHRAFDGHFRAGTVGGKPATADRTYRAARDSTPANARPLLELSPGSLVLGAWDSTRKTRQGRYRSALVGEIIGVLADQNRETRLEPRKGGARVDPVGMSVQLVGGDLLAVMAGQQDELSPKLIDKIEAAAKRRGDRGNSGSVLGLGGIPPALNGTLGVVACSRIIRTHVLSFAALRQLRFGAGDRQGDIACRALLAAYALAGLARSDSELYLRANCDLVEAAPTEVRLDVRGGDHVELDALSIDAADALLEEALEAAGQLAGIEWSGQVFEVVGNPAVYAAASADSGEE